MIKFFQRVWTTRPVLERRIRGILEKKIRETPDFKTNKYAKCSKKLVHGHQGYLSQNISESHQKYRHWGSRQLVSQEDAS